MLDSLSLVDDVHVDDLITVFQSLLGYEDLAANIEEEKIHVLIRTTSSKYIAVCWELGKKEETHP